MKFHYQGTPKYLSFGISPFLRKEKLLFCKIDENKAHQKKDKKYFVKNCKNIWWIQKYVVPLHRHLKQIVI